MKNREQIYAEQPELTVKNEKKLIAVLFATIVTIIALAFITGNMKQNNSNYFNTSKNDNASSTTPITTTNTNKSKDQVNIKKISYSIVKEGKGLNLFNFDVAKYNFSDGYFELKITCDDDIDCGYETVLSKYDNDQNLIWEKDVFVSTLGAGAAGEFLRIDEVNQLVYIVGYNQMGSDLNIPSSPIECIDFNGNEKFTVTPDTGTMTYDLIVNVDSFIVVYQYISSDSNYYLATYAKDGTLIKNERIFDSNYTKFQYMACANEKIYIYDVTDNKILIKDLANEQISEISLKNYFNNLIGIISENFYYGQYSIISNNKLVFLVNVNSKSNYVVIIYDVVKNQFYVTNVIKELNNSPDFLYGYEFDENFNLYVMDINQNEYVINIEL